MGKLSGGCWLQVNIRRYNVVCGPGQCEYQEAATGTAQNWQLQDNPDPRLVEVRGESLPCRVNERSLCLFENNQKEFRAVCVCAERHAEDA